MPKINYPEMLPKAVADAYCIADVCKRLGITATASNYRTINRHIKELQLNTQHFNIRHKTLQRVAQLRIADELVFVENSTYAQHLLKKRIRNNELIPYVCKECQQEPEWNGKELILQLDHINGLHNDNRLINLRFLCPNCHTQTDTYTAKNKTS